MIWPNSERSATARARTRTAIERRRTARWCKGRYTRDSRRRAAANTNTTLVLTNPVLKTRSSKLSVFTRRPRRLGKLPISHLACIWSVADQSGLFFFFFSTARLLYFLPFYLPIYLPPSVSQFSYFFSPLLNIFNHITLTVLRVQRTYTTAQCS